MELKEYLKQSKIKRQSFSDDLKIHYMHLNNIIRKTRRPSADLALRIEQATNGAVTLRELLFPKGDNS